MKSSIKWFDHQVIWREYTYANQKFPQLTVCHVFWARTVPSSHFYYDMRLRITVSIVTDNIVCIVSFWWRGDGWCSWCFHPRNDEASSSNLDRNISWRCYRQKHRTAHIQGTCLIRVQGLWCHVLSNSFEITQTLCWGRVWMTPYIIYYLGT